IDRVADLIDPAVQRLHNISVAEARRLVASGKPEAVREIDGSFALVAQEGETVRMARSLDRPMRFFLAKQAAGPLLVVAARIDAIRAFLQGEELASQFHPSYTRMVPAHHVVEIRLVGCPDPDATYSRFFTPARNVLSEDLDEIGRLYIGALAEETGKWLEALPPESPIGVFFSGGVDSGAVFLTIYTLLLHGGQSPSRLKAFTLS